MSTENAAAASSDSGEMAAAGQQTETAAIVGLQSAADNEPIAKGEVLELGDVSGPSHADAPELEVEAPVNVPSSESGSGNGETLTLSEKKDVQEVEDEAEPGESKTSVIPKDTNTYPEGGLIAWLVVFGAFLIHFFGISLIYITGVFIRAFYYQNVFPGATFSQLSWISTGIGVSLPVLAPAYGYAFVRLGPRVVVIWGAFCLALGFELASLCTETWQIVLTLGLICGIGQSSLWVAAVSTVVQHFNKRRGLVVGMVAAGTGAGGLALAPMAQSLIDNLGWRNALRVLGVVVGSTVGLGGALLFTRFGHEDRMDLRFWKKKTPPEVDESGQPVKKVEKKREPFFDPAFFKNKVRRGAWSHDFAPRY